MVREGTLSPCVEEDGETGYSDDVSEVEAPSQSARAREATGRWWRALRDRWESDFKAWARDALECVGATLVVVWLMVHWYRLKHEPVPDFLQG